VVPKKILKKAEVPQNGQRQKKRKEVKLTRHSKTGKKERGAKQVRWQGPETWNSLHSSEGTQRKGESESEVHRFSLMGK